MHKVLQLFLVTVTVTVTAFCLPLSAFSASATNSVTVTTYDQLLKAIRETRHASEARIEQAVQQEKVREAWETGKLIDEHILQHKERADYGKQVIERLATDLDTDKSELYRMLEFARKYPKVGPAQELSWSHYSALLGLDDIEEINELADRAEKEKWNRDQIREEVRKRKAARGERESKPEEKLTPSKLGKPNTYKIVRAQTGPLRGKLVIDLGFSNYFEIKESDFVTPGRDWELREHDVVHIEFGKKYEITKASAEDLYTYQAYVSHVIDGDTMEVVIDLGFGVWTTQKLRLRGLDSPEIVSKEGKEAKAFVEKLLGISGERFTTTFTPRNKTIPILIKSFKSDKYDRYLADIYFNDEYVNQKLLDHGLATLMKE